MTWRAPVGANNKLLFITEIIRTVLMRYWKSLSSSYSFDWRCQLQIYSNFHHSFPGPRPASQIQMKTMLKPKDGKSALFKMLWFIRNNPKSFEYRRAQIQRRKTWFKSLTGWDAVLIEFWLTHFLELRLYQPSRASPSWKWSAKISKRAQIIYHLIYRIVGIWFKEVYICLTFYSDVFTM